MQVRASLAQPALIVGASADRAHPAAGKQSLARAGKRKPSKARSRQQSKSMPLIFVDTSILHDLHQQQQQEASAPAPAASMPVPIPASQAAPAIPAPASPVVSPFQQTGHRVSFEEPLAERDEPKLDRAAAAHNAFTTYQHQRSRSSGELNSPRPVTLPRSRTVPTSGFLDRNLMATFSGELPTNGWCVPPCLQAAAMQLCLLGLLCSI